MIDISFLVPGIRTHYWKKVYETIKSSCNRHSFELIFSGPFSLPDELAKVENIKYISTYMRPSCALQVAGLAASGRLLLNIADDGIYVPGAMSDTIDLYDEVSAKKDVMNVRYTEGGLMLSSWQAHYHEDLRFPGVPGDYQISLNPMMSNEYWRKLGGWDCSYEYPNYNTHDLMFRLQFDGGIIRHSKSAVIICEFYPYRTGDHGPIHDAAAHDAALLKEKYLDPDVLKKQGRLDLNNWEYYQEPWGRRFGDKLYTSYNEMMGGHNAL